MAGPSTISPPGADRPLRQNAGLLSFLAVTGGLLSLLRARSTARKPFEEKQKTMEDNIDRHPGSTMGRSISERHPTTR
ncbi:hypothetical protein VTO58DRAFT_107960 [Aureobasidium pullulans]